MKKEKSVSTLVVSIFLVGLIFQQAITVNAAPGDPDYYSFGFMGVKTDYVSNKDMLAGSVAQQADGKLLVAGKMTGTGYPFDLLLLRRYNTNGSVDTGFGLSGFGVEIINGQAWYIYGDANIYGDRNSLLVQSDGKIVVAGGYYSFAFNGIRPAVFRFMPWGDLDTSFGNQGRATFDEYSNARASGIELYKGKLLTRINSQLVRLNSDGIVDTSFGTSGKADIEISAFTFTTNRKTGKIIVGGMVPDSDDPNATVQALQHFNTNGTPDTNHGKDGIAVLNLNGPCAHQYHAITSLDTQADGKVVAAGFRGSYPSTTSNFFVRLLPDDSLDTSFSFDGFAVACDGTDDRPIVRVSRTTTQVLALINGSGDGTHVLRRYGSSGLPQLAFRVTSAIDFLIQSNDEKPVTVKTVSYDLQYGIQLRRFVP